MMYCNKIEQSNAGYNEIELNEIGLMKSKLQNVSEGEQNKKKKAELKTKK